MAVGAVATELQLESLALCDLVRSFRRVIGMTQVEFADELDVAKSSVVRWEKRHHFPQPGSLRELAALAGRHNRPDFAAAFEGFIQ